MLKQKIVLGFLLFLSASLSAQGNYEVIIEANKEKPYEEIVELVEAYFDEHGRGKHSGYKQFGRWVEYNRTRLKDGHIQDHGRNIFESYQNSHVTYKENAGSRESAYYNGDVGNWERMSRTSFEKLLDNHNFNSHGMGRVNCITPHPRYSNILYVGTAQGGLWRSYNSGASWTQVPMNIIGCQAISDIVIDKNYNNRMYVLTGDSKSGDCSSNGVYVTENYGSTWSYTGLSAENWNVSNDGATSISFNQGRKMVQVGTGYTYLVATNAGLYKTSNRGASWKKVFSGNVFDIEVFPFSNRYVYITTNREVYKSSDGGETFNLEYVLDDEAIQFGNKTIYKAIRSEMVVKYYAYQSSGTTYYKYRMYFLTGAWDRFQKLSYVDGSRDVRKYYFPGFGSLRTYVDKDGSMFNLIGASDRSQTIRNMVLEAKVNEKWSYKDKLFVGGISLFTNTRMYGPTKWSGVYNSNLHSDICELEYVGNRLYAVGDGGVYYSDDDGVNWTVSSNGLDIGQIYRIGVSGNDYERIILGQQDAANYLYENGTNYAIAGSGDGMGGFIDPENPQVLYYAAQSGGFLRSENEGSNFTKIKVSGNIGTEYFEVPFEMDPKQHETLYAGFTNLWKSTNRGDDWVKVSNGNIPGNRQIYEMEISKNDPNIIYVHNGVELSKSTDGGVTWTALSKDAWGTLDFDDDAITEIMISPVDDNLVFVTCGNYQNDGAGNGIKKVYMTNNGGETWTDISGNIPDIPVNCIEYQIDNNRIYIGTDMGVYFMDRPSKDWSDDDYTWYNFSNKIPRTQIRDLELDQVNKKLVAATWGSGLWRSDIAASCRDLITYEGTQSGPVTHNNSNIVSSESFTGNSTVVYASPEYVSMKDGFHIQATDANQNSFHASIDESIELCYDFGSIRLLEDEMDENYIGAMEGMIEEDLELEEEWANIDESLINMEIYPNPSSDMTTMAFYIPEESEVSIYLYDILGNKVKTLVDQQTQEKGYFQMTVNVDELAPGMYMVNMYLPNGLMKQSKLIVQ